MTQTIGRDWPAEDLQEVGSCPFCHSTFRQVAYRNVQDWTFGSAPGRWTYWDCSDCKSLYLDPRPTEASIGAAYQRYYTHSKASPASALSRLKQRILNECWSHWLRADIQPRIGLPRGLALVLRPLRERIPPPFELVALADLPRGALLDIGCGSGTVLKLCSLLGWKATGLEIDPAAVQAARAVGLEVREGTYRVLAEYPNAFDYVICSHVVEHVHDPHVLLRLIAAALKEGGFALISCPNSQSHVRRRFGSSWRGLEAPRHLAIPSLDYLTSALQKLGFSVNAVQPLGAATAKLSKQILAKRIESADVVAPGEDKRAYPLTDRKSHPDLIQLVCRKTPQVPA